MVNLTRASRELFSRAPDERFESFDCLLAHCRQRRERSCEHWQLAQQLCVDHTPAGLRLQLEDAEATALELSDWSFTQLCRLCGVQKDTVNKLASETAARVFHDTMPCSRKPLQVYAAADAALAVHGSTYSRLYDEEVLRAARHAAPDFTPPPTGLGGATGLYAGEQDMFAFGIDPNGWVEVNGENFAPGFFVWNSEVGRRSVGVQTFWYQAICQNHIVWDAIEVVELKRRHTGDVQQALDDVRRAIEQLVKKRDERRDSFASSVRQAMATPFGEDAEEVRKQLAQRGVSSRFAEQVVRLAGPRAPYSVFAVVDAMTRIAGRYDNAGDRLVVDQQAAALLSLAA